MAYQEFSGELDKPTGFVEFSGQLDDATPPVSARKQPFPSIPTSDPMGSDIGASIMDAPAPRKSVFEDILIAAPAHLIERRGAPVTQEEFQSLRNRYDSATAEQRAKLVQTPGYRGGVYQTISEQYGKQDKLNAQSPTARILDTRREARRDRLIDKGLDGQVADDMARVDARTGFDGRQLDSMKASDFDFAAQQEYERPKAKGVVTETDGMLGVRSVQPRGIDDAIGAARAIGGKVSATAQEAASGAWQALGDLTSAVGDVTDSSTLGVIGDRLSSGNKVQQQEAKRKLQAIGDNPNGALDFIESGVSGAITNVIPFLAGPATGLSAMGAQVFGKEYGEGKIAGLSPTQSAARASLMTAAEIIGEAASLPSAVLKPFRMLTKNIPAEEIMPAFAKMLVKENLAEQVTTAMQFGIDKLKPIGLRPHATLDDYLQDVGETFKQTMAQTLVMGGTGVVADKAGQALQRLESPERALQREIDNSTFNPAATDAAARDALSPYSNGTNNLQVGGTMPVPAAPAITNFTPSDSPTAQAGLAPIVVPNAPETTNVSLSYATGDLAAGGSDVAGGIPGRSVDSAGLAPLVTPGGGVGLDAQQPGLGDAAAVPAGTGTTERPAAVGGIERLPNLAERATDSDLLSRVTAALPQPENNNADIRQPVEQWVGRKGDGYVTLADAEQALPGRQSRFQDLDWKVEQMPSGKYRLAGYATTQENANATQAPQAQQAAQEGSQAPAAAAVAAPITAPSGNPFSTQQTAQVFAQQNGIVSYSAVQVDGGWALQPTEAANGVGLQDQGQGVAGQTTASAGVTGQAAPGVRNLDQRTVGFDQPGQPAGAAALGGVATDGTAPALKLALPAPAPVQQQAFTALKASNRGDVVAATGPLRADQQAASALSRMMGKTATFFSVQTPGTVAPPNAFVTNGDTKNIFLDSNSDDAPTALVFHEGYHLMPPEKRKVIAEQLMPLFRQDKRAEFGAEFGYTDAQIDEEIPAFIAQSVSRRPEFMGQLKEKLKNKEFASAIGLMIDNMKSILTRANKTYGQGFSDKYISDVQKAVDVLSTAYAEHMDSQGEGVQGEGTGAVTASERSRIDMDFKDVIRRTPELQAAAEKIKSGEMTAAEYDRLVNESKPVEEYKTVPAPATSEQAIAALRKTNAEKEGTPTKDTYYGVPSRTLKAGDPVGLRLDIPSYSKTGTWVVTVHGPRKSMAAGGAGTRIGYESAAGATDVEFGISDKGAINIASGKEKSTIATMEGKWKPTTPAEAKVKADQALKSKDWAQVGMDPERHSYFYDRKTMEPIVSADEVIQIGPLVLAKNPVYGEKADFMFSERSKAEPEPIEPKQAGVYQYATDKSGRITVSGDIDRIRFLTKKIGFPGRVTDNGVVYKAQEAADVVKALSNQPKLNPDIAKAIATQLNLSEQELASTSLEYRTGEQKDRAFVAPLQGQVPETVRFLEERRRASGLRLLDISKEEDQDTLAKLIAAETLAAIRSSGNALEWYNETIAKTLAMAAVKYPELATDRNAQMLFRVAMAVTSQGLNVENNLKFTMRQYDSVRRTGRFPEVGEGDASQAMVSNFELANKLLEDMKPDLFRRFLVTEFTIGELNSAGFDPGGELVDEKVLGSSVFGPKIGFGFYSNLNGNFEPVTMDMWFMRTIGRLIGHLRAFDAEKFGGQIKRFRDAFDTRGEDGVFADRFDGELIDRARSDEGAAIELARQVKKAHEKDYKTHRAAFDDGTRAKTELVLAADTMITSVDKPKDVPGNGTERRQLRAVVKRAVDMVEQSYGQRIPPAAMQALIWYPEQELYKALGVKLSVTSQDYAGATEKVLKEEGYDEQRLRTAAQSGARRVRQANARDVGRAAQGDGKEARRSGPLQAGERTEFIRTRYERNELAKEQENPKRKGVIFEVAPDPNDQQLTDAWRGLSSKQRLTISERVLRDMVPKVLDYLGTSGIITAQVGSYLDDTNPSFSLFLDKGDAVEVAKALGFVLAQDSMMIISPKAFKGGSEVGAIAIDVGTKTSQEINKIYQALRQIKVNGQQPIGGQSYANGKMTILNYSDVPTKQLAILVDQKLNKAYTVMTRDVFAAFPEKQEYDYASEANDGRGSRADLRRRARDLRTEASAAVQRELASAGKLQFSSRAQPESEAAGARPALTSLKPEDVLRPDTIAAARAAVDKYKRPDGPDPLTKKQRLKGELALKPLFDAARSNKPEFDRTLERIAEEVGGFAKLPGIKKPVRAVTKLVKEMKGDVSKMKDLLRGTIVVSSAQEAQDAINQIGQVYRFDRIKNRMGADLVSPDGTTVMPEELPTGYQDILTNVILDDGTVAEIQITTPEMAAAKNLGHEVYAFEREMPKGPVKDRMIALQKQVYAEGRSVFDARVSQYANSSSNSSRDTSPALLRTSEGLRGSGSGIQAVAEDMSAGVVTGTSSQSKNRVPAGSDLKSNGISTSTDSITKPIGQGIQASNRQQPIQGQQFYLKGESRTDATRIALQDYFLRVKQVQDALTAQGGTVGEAQNVYLAEELSYGRLQEQLVDFKEQVVKPLIKQVKAADLELSDLALYAYARHAKERNAAMRSINARLRRGEGSGMTDDESDDIITAFRKDGKEADLQRLHGKLMDIVTTTRLVLLDEGLITRDEYDAWSNKYSDYVPLRGFSEDEEDMVTGARVSSPRMGGKGFNIRGKESVRALGRTSRAGHIIENIVSDYERAVARAERNNVAKVFLDLATTNPDANLWEIDAERTSLSLNRQTGAVQANKLIDKGEDTISVKLDGKEVYVKIHDPLLVRALRQASKDETGQATRLLAKGLGWYTTLMRNTLTRFNPAFGFTNAVKDVGFGAVSALGDMGPKGAALFMKHYANPVQSGPMFEEFRAAGATTGGWHMRDAKELQKEIQTLMDWEGGSGVKAAAYKLGKGTLDALEFIGTASETQARFAAYKAARELGKSPAQAGSIAKNLTTNFNRKGEWGAAMNTLYLFFNAGVQGSAKMASNLKSPWVMGAMAGLTGLSAGLALYGASAGGDDDDGEAYWDKIPDFEKERNLIVMLPPGKGMMVKGENRVGTNGRYIKIPIQYGLNVFSTMGYQVAGLVRHAQDQTRGVKPSKAAINMTSVVFGAFNPMGGSVDVTNPIELGMAASPSIVDLGIQLGAGVNSFGRPVAPTKSPFDTKPDSENFSPNMAGTWEMRLARWMNAKTGGDAAVSGMVDVSPGTVRNVVRNATGGTGDFLSSVFVNIPSKLWSPDGELGPRDVPVLKAFYGEVDATVDMGMYYERRAEVMKAAEDAARQQKLGIRVDYDAESRGLQSLGNAAKQFGEQMGRLRKAELAVAEDAEAAKPRYSETERNKIRKDLQETRATLASQFNAIYYQMEKNVAAGKYEPKRSITSIKVEPRSDNAPAAPAAQGEKRQKLTVTEE